MHVAKQINVYIIFFILFSPITGYLTRVLVNIHIINFSALLIILASSVLIYFSIVEKQKLNIPIYVQFLALFFFYTLFSDYVLVHKTINFEYFYRNTILTALLICFLVENTDFNEELIDIFLNIIKYIILISVIVILVQATIAPFLFASQDNMELYNNYSFQLNDLRFPSIYSWVSPLANGFGFLPLFIIYLSFLFMREKSLIVFYYILGAIFCFLTQDRWVMANYLVSFWLIYIYKKERKFLIVFYTSAIISLVLISVPILQSFNIPIADEIENRIFENSTGGFGSGSSSTRLLAVYAFAELFPENPFFGKGHLHTFGGDSKDVELKRIIGQTSSQMHVGYLSLLYYYGIFGGLLFLLFMYQLMKHLYLTAKVSNYWGSFFAMLGFVLANLTLVTFSIYEMGLVMALVFNKYFSGIEDEVLAK